MVIARALEQVVRQTASVVTVGSFDGVHLGHGAIIDRVLARASAISGRSVVVTFDPHPREVVGRGRVEYLSTLDERLHHLEMRRIDLAVVLAFTYEFSRMTPELFCRNIVVGCIGVTEVIVGHDHLFGRDREAGFVELQKLGTSLGFTATEVDPVRVNGAMVNSTSIRTALMRGDVETASALLGRPYAFRGTVVPGAGRGTRIGFPTANVSPAAPKKIVPGGGVYLVRVLFGERAYYGMLNIGTRPTFEEGTTRIIEVHLFAFDGAAYGGEIELQFLRRLREERKFASQEELVAQLHRDRSWCLKQIGQQ